MSYTKGQQFASIVPPPPAQYIPMAAELQSRADSGRVLFARALSSSGADPAPRFNQAAAQNPLQAQLLRYDELGGLLQRLGNASAARAQGQAELQSAQNVYTNNDRTLQANLVAKPKLEKRLYRNAHPRFLHYIQIDREGKVKRLQQELDNLNADIKRQEDLQVQYAQDIDMARQRLAQLQSTEDQMRAGQAEMQKIFDNIVDGQQPTPNLQALRYQASANNTNLSAETALLASVGNSLSAVENARSLFGVAMSELNQAMSFNRGAQQVNFIEAVERNPGYGYDEFYERNLQMQRDRLLNQARMTALRAADQLQAAFNSFPMEARVRHPQLTANICNAPIPNLRGANLFGTLAVGWAFGTMGDMMNDMRAQQKLMANMAILQQCEQIAAQQSGLIRAILQTIQANVANLESEKIRLTSGIQGERRAIFENVKRSVFGPYSNQAYAQAPNSTLYARFLSN